MVYVIWNDVQTLSSVLWFTYVCIVSFYSLVPGFYLYLEKCNFVVGNILTLEIVIAKIWILEEGGFIHIQKVFKLIYHGEN